MGFLKRLFGNPSPSPSPSPAPARPVDPFDLDTPLLALSPADAWRIRDACEGTQVFGAIGSGKTSGSGAAIAKAFLSHGFGGLVLCAKPEERRLWEQYATQTGRTSSLVVFSPTQPWRFNFLDYELRRQGSGGGQTENLVRLFSSVTEIVEGKQGVASGGDPFWERAGQELIRNAVDLLALAGESLTLAHLLDFVTSAPQTPAQVGDSKWRQGYCARCVRAAEQRPLSPREQHDLATASRYWLQSYPVLADRTRSGVVAHVTSVADVLLHGIAWDLLATETNIVPEVTYKNGAVIVLDLSVQEYDRLGRIVQGIWKLMFQRAILRRDAVADPRPVFLWADEAQNFISSFDYQYQAVARSARACTVYLSQNINNYYSVLGAQGRDEANALLGNFQTKIFHANGDHATNTYAADLIAQDWTMTTSINRNTQDSGQGSRGGGFSESVQYKILPGEFSKLRKGGPANNLEVDAVVFQGGRVWEATGDTYLPTVFKQG